MPFDTSLAEAKARVESITRGHGYLDERVLGRMTSEIRQTVENTLMKKSEFGVSVNALAKSLEDNSNCFGRFSRFVTELLQNADENSFTQARARNEDPYVSFKIAPTYIVIECNEDGFTSQNLAALCSIGRSHKADPENYFGQQGIGFKSVFTVAYKVVIQSGLYSFSFNHKPGQSGMGMITPTWEYTINSPPTGVTRMKLFLQTPTSNHHINDVTQQFQELQATHLLFLRNIVRIEIVYMTDADVIASSKNYSIVKDTEHLVFVIEEQGTERKLNHYHVARRPVRRIPQPENLITPGVSSGLHRSSSEVVLAFPLDETRSNPVISRQHVFAFSPIGNPGFKFLIQADFTVSTFGGTVDSTSKRNQALLVEITRAFCEALRQLDNNEDLRYKWMRYLPQGEGELMQGYWKALHDHIKAAVQTMPLMYPSNGTLMKYKIGGLKQLPVSTLDSNGDATFEDNFPAIYPSKDYLVSDLNHLTRYGLRTMTVADLIDIVSNDLSKLNPRMMSAETSDQWHTAIAKFLSSLFEGEYEVESRRVRGLKLIPLANGKWIEASNPMTNPLSFASTNGLEIPQDLPLTFISPSATRNVARVNLFRLLGATEPAVLDIRRLIFDQYPSSNSSKLNLDKFAPSESVSIKHLKFLFLTHTEDTMDAEGYERLEDFTWGTGVLFEVLKYYWPEVRKGLQKYPSLGALISNFSVPCTNEPTKLKHTYLPDPDLIAFCSQFLGNAGLFPFPDFSGTAVPNNDLSAWTFLCDHFGVGDSKDSLFYLNLLQTVSEADQRGNFGESVPTKTFDLYKLLYDEVSASATTNKPVVRDQIRHVFRYPSLPIILLPVEGDARERWRKIEDCRWDCPKNMMSLSGLLPHYSDVYEETILASTIMPFMRDVVGVSDLSPDDIVKELLTQKKDPNGDLLYELYSRLDGLLSWPGKSEVSFQENLSRHIIDLRCWRMEYCSNMGAMFVGILGVPSFKLSLHERLQIAGMSDCTPVPEIKDLLRRFNSLLSSANSRPDPKPILESRIFPIKAPDGSVQLLSATTSDFTIIDQKSPEGNFRGLVRGVASVLDFSLDEVSEFQPFIQWARLEDRFLSAKVTKVTKVPSSAEILRMSERSVRARAYGLCRIATHFECPRSHDSRELYRILKTCKVFESPSICSELSLIENGSILVLEKSEVDLYFDWKDNALNIYIPNDTDRQDLCFLHDLPHALFEWMMNRSPDTIPEDRVSEPAQRLVMNILNSKTSLVGRLLDREGVTKLEFPEDDKKMDEAPSQKPSVKVTVQPVRSDSPAQEEEKPGFSSIFEFRGDSNDAIQLPALSIFSAPSLARQPRNSDGQSFAGQGIGQTERLTPSRQATNYPQPPRSSSPCYLRPSLLAGENTHSRRRSTQVAGEINTQQAPTYVALLDKVIRVARRSSLMRKWFDLSEMGQALFEIEHETAEDYFNHPASAGGDKNTKIGAAGELYVFELLSKVIPNLSRDVWKSKIRYHVTTHPKYSDMGSWKGEEMTDCNDSDSRLTTALIDSGYLDKATWNKRKPRYYIETKATPGACNVAFYLSKKQDKMISDMSRFRDYEGHEAIYVVFRVFNLGKECMTHEIYVNPKDLEDQGILLFHRPESNYALWHAERCLVPYED
ncbi:hypothetical protein F5Y03DRAFT_399109 [Xylaria venustula]|nr:hypothetical protein F5Y03DRAFT_399109 [Xylaria venustula]